MANKFVIYISEMVITFKNRCKGSIFFAYMQIIMQKNAIFRFFTIDN